jgi:hypothetical protein
MITTEQNPTASIDSTDMKEINVGVGWIIFENMGYSSLRFHRSIYEFDCEKLQLLLDNWQLKKDVAFERHRYCELHSKFKKITTESEHKS